VISDLDARIEALDPRSSFIVQAPAGSGKTGLLVYRMLTLLAAVEQPQQVLAITFTRKATAEMRERVFELIAKAEQSELSDDAFEQQGIDLAWAVVQRDRKLGWNLLDSPQQLQILTIDAFCARLTSSMPWLSRLGDRPRTTDDAEQHYSAAVEQLFSTLLSGDSRLSRALSQVLLELDFNYNRARKLFVAMLAKRDQWLRHILVNDLQALRSSLEYAWQTVSNEQLAYLQDSISDAQLQQLVDLATLAAPRIQAAKDGESPLAGFESFDKSIRLLGLSQWRSLRILCLGKGVTYRKQIDKRIGFPPGCPEKDQLKAVLADLQDNHLFRDALLETDHIPALQFSDNDWQQLVALEEVLKSLAAFLQLRFRAAGECDHNEVTQRANLALQELDSPTDLALRMDYQIQHILVDEFQDTSHGQIELLRRLTSGWGLDDHGPAKTLFLVGDPMQSIYRFREADVSLFLRVAENAQTRVFDNINIRSLRLSENFRSSANLVDWFNTTFEDSFPATNNVLSGGIRYANASSNAAAGGQAVSFYTAEDRAGEAQQTLNAIKTAIAELPDADAKVALLIRGRSQLNQIVPLLQTANIPYQGVDIRPLADQQAVIDLVALCKALSREDDRVSWLALLRGPWCGLSLSEISLILQSSNTNSNTAQATVWQSITEFERRQPVESHQLVESHQPVENHQSTKEDTLASESLARLSRFTKIMHIAMAQRQQVDLASLARWSWQALGGEVTLFGASLEDIETVFRLIQELQQGGDLPSLSLLDTTVQRLYAQPSGDPQARLVISTMHKAKGLQYHTVILPSLSSPPGSHSKDIMMWTEHQSQSGDSQLLLAPFLLETGPGSHYHYLRELEKKRALNETIRLMYVACTRAESKLVLVAQLAVTEDEANAEIELRRPRTNTLLACIWDQVEGEFKQALSLPSAEGTTEDKDASPQLDATQLDQTLTRLPANFVANRRHAIEWQAEQQLSASAEETESETESNADKIEYQWSTEVATAVGVVMHNWLQHNQASLAKIEVTEGLRQQWRAELAELRVPAARIGYGIERLQLAAENIRQDQQAHFIFADHAEQKNEYSIATLEQGLVKTYRLDRTFVDKDGTRWIVDYKTTYTRASDLDSFVDQQVTERHQKQLHHYAALMRQMDSRPIKLAVYFPMLAKLRSWDYAL